MQHRRDPARRQRARDQEPLDLVAAQRPQDLELCRGFDAFRVTCMPSACAIETMGLHEDFAFAGVAQFGGEGAVDLSPSTSSRCNCDSDE